MTKKSNKTSATSKNIQEYAMKRYYELMAIIVLVAGSAVTSAEPGRLQGRGIPASIATLKLDQPLFMTGITPQLGRGLAAAEGRQQIIVRLKGAPVAQGGNKQDIEQEQAVFLQRCLAL
ncbi:MAG: hypothetical protein ACJATP_003255, partial [Candidatus Azotimanducaceae bacterium]